MAQHDQNTRETSMNETPLPTFSFHQNIQIGSALVIGGCGFLGHHVVKTLLAEPTCTSVAVMSRSPFKRRFSNVTYHLGDITKSEHVDNLICQLKPNVIVNTASPHAYIDHEHAHEYFSVNVDGNQHVLDSAAKAGSVRAIVYTSSGPIIAGTGAGYDHADETQPTLAWPTIRKGDPYHLAKALGERKILEADGQHGIRTACIRPTALYGEGDEQMIEPVMGVLEDGQSHIWMGYNDVYMDSVYVGHVAEAHILAIKGLLAEVDNPHAPKVGGEAFNITDDEPYPPWTFFRKLWTLAGDKTPLSSVWMIPSSMVMMMAYIAEWLVWAWSFGKHRPSMLKIERMEFLTLTRTYSIAKIRSRLGFQPWAKQPYKSVDEAVQGSLDWFIQPENHGPIKLPSKTNSRPETPFRLISSTGATTIPGIPHDHYCVKNARIMAQTHNTFFRALNSIYQTSISIRAGTQEASDFLSYCRIVYEFIHSHQCHEESFFFPTIERETGISGLMDENIAQHKAMDSGLEAFRSYAEKTPSSSYSGVTLRSIIDSFAPAFESHNHAEISTILSLHSKISSSALQKIDEEFRSHAEKESDMFKAGPLVLGCQDNTFIIDDDIYPFPSVPFIVKVIVDLVLSRKHGGVWRFNPCSIYGRPRALPTFGVEDGKVSGKSDVVTKGMQFKSGVVVGSFRRLVPVFAALISVWSILSLVLL